MYYSPVIVFAYNRLGHLKKTINSLKKNIYANRTTLIIYLDYPKSKEAMYDYLLVKNFCSKIKGFKKKTLILRKRNFGLSKNIISAVNFEIQKYKSLIILEDDMVCDKYFLKYMNFFLDAYKNNKNVVSIHGYNYPLKNKKKLNDFFFLKGADCWGWGTWPSKWKIYSRNTNFLIKKIKKNNLKKDFNFNNSYNYYKMLNDKLENKNNSWAINWYASAFLKNKLTLYPKHSLIKNIGMDGTGIHSQHSNKFRVRLRNKAINLNKNIIVKENQLARVLFINFFKSLRMDLKNLIFNKLKNVIVSKKIL
tara:strand:+ start:154 stop:1074 length:921 start_codon:yes stop_codon:yes gene_type:complete